MSLWRLWKSLRGGSGKPPPAEPISTAPEKHAMTLFDLPPEMVHLIASFLPASSAAALALCSHRAISILGTQYWTALGSWRDGGGHNRDELYRLISSRTEKPPQNTRSDFLSLLERDLPEYIFCQRCALLHIPIFEHYSPKDRARSCYFADIFPSIQWGLSPYTRFSLLQGTMKRHRMGFTCNKELCYFSLERCSWRKCSIGPDCGTYDIKEARIRNGNFLVRAQYWCLLPMSYIGLLPGLERLTLCSHLSYGKNGSLMESMISCKLNHWSTNSPCLTCDGLGQCPHCYTEFQLDVKDLGKHGMALVVTTWTDLGECRSPFDSKWKLRDICRECIFNIECKKVPVFESGVIREAFGDGGTFLFDSTLTPKREAGVLRSKL